MEIDQLHCCGLTEIANIGDNATQTKTLLKLVEEWYTPAHQERYSYVDWITGKTKVQVDDITEFCRTPAHAIFSSINKEKYGEKLVELITKHGLGSVIKTEPKHNANSGNDVICYVWTVDHEKFKEYARKVTKKTKEAKKK